MKFVTKATDELHWNIGVYGVFSRTFYCARPLGNARPGQDPVILTTLSTCTFILRDEVQWLLEDSK